MTVPRHPEKHGESALVTPEASVAHFYDEAPPAPDAVILCYHDAVLDHAAEAYATTPLDAFGDGYALEDVDGDVGIVRVPGVGAPAAALTMEELIARGTEAFVSLGYAGGLHPDVQVGDVVVVDSALRDEGTSHHYLEPGEYVDAHDEVREPLAATLGAAGEGYDVGPAWTTDAPHRETRTEVERYRSAGILAVDMEAAAVFAVAEHRGATAGALFTISDVLDPEGWEPAFEETEKHLEPLLTYAVEALVSRPG